MSSLTSRRILLVDDTRANIDILVQTLRQDYKLGVALNGSKAIEYTQSNRLDLILLDVLMPGMDGFQVCHELKKNPATKNIPIIFITAMNDPKDKKKGLEIGAVDYITKPFDISEVKARVKTHLSLKITQEELNNRNIILEEKIKERTRELKETQVEIIKRLSLASKYRESGTGQSVTRVSKMSELIGSAAGLSETEAETLGLSSMLHDAGKIGIADSILLKEGKLTKDEWMAMQTHTTIGSRLLSGSKSKLIQDAEMIALTHHEKWDGTGYNKGLAGEEIPLISRIVSLCHVFDALISIRPYKEAWPIDKAFAEIKSKSGKDFDPRLVDIFINLKSDIFKIIEETKLFIQ